jgi:ribosomal protein S3AE
MSKIKDKIQEIVEKLPEEYTFEEILQELSFNAMILRGINDSENGDITSHDDLKKEINNW